jgi:hypothetical protein
MEFSGTKVKKMHVRLQKKGSYWRYNNSRDSEIGRRGIQRSYLRRVQQCHNEADLNVYSNPYKWYLCAPCVGISAVMWRCPRCNLDIGGSLGELKYHWKRAHPASTITKIQTTGETAA